MENIFYPLIDSCDLLISVYPKPSSSKDVVDVKYTPGVQRERQYAKSIGKPMFSVIYSEDEDTLLTGEHCIIQLVSGTIYKTPKDSTPSKRDTAGIFSIPYQL